MCTRKVMYSLLSRVGATSSRVASSRGLPLCGLRMADCEHTLPVSLQRQSLSTSCPFLLKDEALGHKSGQDSIPNLPAIEQDEDIRSILNDIWNDFEYVPPKSKSSHTAEDNSSSASALAQKNEVSKQQANDKHHVRDLLLSAKLNAKKLYYDEDSTTILDTLEKQRIELSESRKDVEYYPELIKIDEFEGFNLARGITGVFDLDELVDILRAEKLSDIFVATVPEEMAYCDYLVVATAVSPRQARAVSEFLKKLYKRKKGAADPTLFIEGKDCQNWKALDLGNIVLHVFLPSARSQYDLETLWTVGSDYDDLTHAKDDPVFDMLQEQLQLLQNMKPMETHTGSDVAFS